MKRTFGSSRLLLGLTLFAFFAPLACTTGTDVTADTPAIESQARLDHIALLARRLVEDARAHPQKPAAALVEDLTKIMQEAESP